MQVEYETAMDRGNPSENLFTLINLKISVLSTTALIRLHMYGES